MITIRGQQMAVFGASQRRRFVEEMVVYLESAHANALATSQLESRGLVQAAIARASALGADSERAARTVLDLIMLEGADLGASRAPWVRAILVDTELSGEERIALLALRHAQAREEPRRIPDDSDAEFV